MNSKNPKSEIRNSKQIPNPKSKNSKYKAVIFDLGDVYYQNGFKKVLALLARQKRIKPKFLDEVFRRPYIKKIEVNKITERVFWEEFRKDIGLEFKTSVLRKAVFKYFKPTPGMKALVKDCRKKVKVGLLTNNIKEWFKIQEQKEDFNKSFDKVLVSAKIGLRKPDKKIYFLMAKMLGVKSKECIFFDDNLDNIKGAKKAGMKAFRFKGTADCRRKLNNFRILQDKKVKIKT